MRKAPSFPELEYDDLAGDPNEEAIEDKLGDQAKPEHVTYSIASYGADYPVDGLVQRMRQTDIIVPEFQRRFVWPLPKASRFIESLLLGLPVPGIFLSRRPSDQKLLVIDGQQRLETLRAFYDGIWPKTEKKFSLVGVDARFNLRTYKTLEDPDRRRLDDSILHATVVKQESPTGEGGVYHIFERLNTGGMILQPQEIRACIYTGEVSKVLKEANKRATWRDIFGKESPRLRDQELILRFLALLHDRAEYQEPMKDFLNDFMEKKRNISKEEHDAYLYDFGYTIDRIHQALGKSAFRVVKALNAAFFDGFMIAVCEAMHKGHAPTVESIRKAHARLVKDKTFLEAVTSTTADREKINKRIQRASESLSR